MAAPAPRPAPSATEAALAVLAVLVAVMWVLEVADATVLDHGLDDDGIRPRSLGGLLGIATAPFLHAGFGHLLANTLALVPLSLLAILQRAREYVPVLVAGALGSGALAWLISPSHVVVIGASGVVFGLLGFLLFRGWFTRRPVAILLSLVVAALFYGALRGLLPSSLPISWQGHLGGFLAGIGAARLLPSAPDAG